MLLPGFLLRDAFWCRRSGPFGAVEAVLGDFGWRVRDAVGELAAEVVGFELWCGFGHGGGCECGGSDRQKGRKVRV